MREKNILIGVFVKKDKILSFMEFLKNEFNIKYKKIYINKIKGNETENTNTKQETQNDKTSYFSLFPQIIPIEPKENTPKVKKEESSEE